MRSIPTSAIRRSGAKINGRIAPLLSPLHNGDEVEIVRAEGQTPPAAWESIAVTGKARAAIRRATREAVRAQYAGLGRQIVLRAFERAGKPFSDDKLKLALPRLARANIEDVLAAVGRGEMFSGDVVKAVYPDFKEERKAATAPPDRTRLVRAEEGRGHAVQVAGRGAARRLPIRGLRGDLPVRFAPNGGAVPGDRIVGILTPGEGDHDLSDPVAGADGVRRPAGTLARRALGHRGTSRSCSRRRSWSPRSTSRARSAPSPL